MKHVVMLFALLLTFGLLVACGKDDPDDLYDDLKAGLDGGNDEYESNDSIQYPTYEADWVLDRQVIDKTVMRNINNQRLEIAHMPNEVLLKNVSEIQGLPILGSSSFTCFYENLAYDGISMYFGESNSKSFTVSEDYRSGNYYLVKVGEEEYAVGLDYQTDGTYNQNTDQWTLKWTVSRVNLHEANSPSSVMFGYTFDPALTLMLISTKRLN